MKMDAVSTFVILALCAALAVALVTAAVKYPVACISLAVLCVLAVSCSKADELRFEVSIVAESSDDRAAIDEAVSYASNIFRTQLGIELAATHSDLSSVAGHTKAEALLDAVKLYRFNNAPHAAADATVLFTRRTLTRGFEGIATVGPACSAQASAVVVLRSDGYDGQVFAHELLHTLGVPHDHAAGYLMSESVSRAGSDYVSADTLLTVKAAPLAECMSKPVASSIVPAGTPAASPSGGGGSFDMVFAVLLVALAGLVFYQHRVASQIAKRNEELAGENARLSYELSYKAPPRMALLGIMGTYRKIEQSKLRSVCVSFADIASTTEFHYWLVKAQRQARDEAEHEGGA